MGVAMTILLLSWRLGEGLLETSSLEELGSDWMLRLSGVGRRQEAFVPEPDSPCLWTVTRVATPLEALQEALRR